MGVGRAWEVPACVSLTPLLEAGSLMHVGQCWTCSCRGDLCILYKVNLPRTPEGSRLIDIDFCNSPHRQVVQMGHSMSSQPVAPG